MVVVARQSDMRILSRYDAWSGSAIEDAMEYVKENGYTYVRDYITPSGDMVILVK